MTTFLAVLLLTIWLAVAVALARRNYNALEDVRWVPALYKHPLHTRAAWAVIVATGLYALLDLLRP